jgi:hypothetical protein
MLNWEARGFIREPELKQQLDEFQKIRLLSRSRRRFGDLAFMLHNNLRRPAIRCTSSKIIRS